MTLCGGRVFPCKPTTTLFQTSETSIFTPTPCCNSEHLWWAPLHRMEFLCLGRACDRLGSTALRLLLQFSLVLYISPLWFERSLCLLLKYDTAVRGTTEHLIFWTLTCPKEYTFKSTEERWLPEDRKRATQEWSQMIQKYKQNIAAYSLALISLIFLICISYVLKQSAYLEKANIGVG